MSPAALLAAIAMPLYIAMAISIVSTLISLTHIVFTRAARAPKTTAKKDVFSFVLGGLANTVSVSVNMQSYAAPTPATSPSPSTPPTQVPLQQQQQLQQHAQPVCEAPSETAPASPSVLSAANAKMKRVARTTRALECATVPGVVELPIRGMQCAVM
jgi:hypothetical protein